MQRFCLPELVYAPHFLTIVVDAKNSGPPHVVKLWFRSSKGVLTVKPFYVWGQAWVCSL